MHFLDANIFIYAFYKPKRKLNPKEEKMKKQAKNIIQKILNGEEAVTSVIHISEITNILKHALSIQELNKILLTLLTLPTLKIVDVTKELYIKATLLADEIGMEPNDALAITIMRDIGIKKIYTFDKDFDRVKNIERDPKI
ncbi:MAG: type II toxin-antitoxin system VapC family toxin [Candidatus Njordarchaeia archaeon]